MKTVRILLLAAALLTGSAATAQTLHYNVLETGWGRIEKNYKQGASPGFSAVGEMNIPRWRKTSGTLTVDLDKKEVTLTQKRKKDKTFTLLSDTTPGQTRDGWTYTEYMALDGNNSVCHFWLCTHESGLRRLLTLYPWSRPDTVYGYMLEAAE